MAARSCLTRQRESRTFLDDGDTVIFRSWRVREGYAGIGFGEVRGTLPAA